MSVSDPCSGPFEVAPELSDRLYPAGTPVTLTAIPEAGGAFGYWRIYDPNHPGDLDHARASANTVLHLTMDSDWEVMVVYPTRFDCGFGTDSAMPTILGALAFAVVVRRRGQSSDYLSLVSSRGGSACGG